MATRYWVWGSGNWSDSTNHWATSSGGAPWVANTPTHLDNVVFDSLSNATAYTMTVDKESFCADITFAAPLVGDMTFAGSASLNVYWNLTLYATLVRTSTSIISFKSTSTWKTITLAWVTMAAQMTFNGVGGGWTLQDAFNIWSGTLLLNAWTLNTNWQTVTCGWFNSSTKNTRTLTLGASVVNCTSFTNTISDNLTLNASTSSIRVTWNGNFAWGWKTYYEVQLNGTSHTVSDANTFTTLTRTATATKTDTMTLSADQTVSGTFTATGNSATNRLLVQSDTKWTARTITAAVVTVDKVDFLDITGAGAASWDMSAAAWYTGDCGGNSMKALGSAAFTTAANQYMKTAVSINWSASNWYTASGGATPGRVPLPQDTAIFDANSITAWAVQITNDMPRIGSCDWTGVTNTPSWRPNAACSVFGSITLIAGMTLTTSTPLYTMEGRSTYTITNGGNTWGKPFTIDAPGWTYTFQDTFNIGGAALTLTNGTLNTNWQTVTCGAFASNNSNTRVLTLWASTVNVTSWTLTTSTGLTFNTNTSTIVVTWSWAFAWWALTYNIVQLNGTAHTVSGVNTFTTLTRTGTATKTNTLTFTNNQIISWVLTLAGNSTTNRLLVNSTTKGTQVTLTAWTVTASNVDIQDIIGAGSASWNLSGITGNSGDCGGNTNITFTSPVTTDWQSGTTWSTATWSSRVPLPQDTATFTTAGVATITQDMPRIGSVDFSTSANKTWTTSTACSVFGSIDLTNLATLTASSQLYTFEWRSAYTLNSGSVSWGKALTINSPSTTCTLGSNLTLNGTNLTLTVTTGTLDVSGSNYVISSWFISIGASWTITLGSWTHTLTCTTGACWNWTGTVNAGTSTIKFTWALTGTVTFTWGGRTYNNFWNATTWAFACIITGSNTFNDFKIDAGRTVNFTAFTIQTVTTFTAVGTVGNVITLQSATAGSRAYLKDTSGTNTCDYLSIKDIGVTWGAIWNEWANSTFVSGNIGWAGNPSVNRYWVPGGNGYWDSTTNWSTSSWWASGATVPVGENVYFDASSGAGDVFIVTSSGNPTVNTLDCTWFTGTFIWSSWVVNYSSITFVSWMTLLSTWSINFKVNGASKTFTSATRILLWAFNTDLVSDTLTLQDAITSNSTATHTSGIMDFNNLNHSFTTFASTNSNTRTITMWSGTLTLSGTGTVWNMATITGLTLTEWTSTIKVTDASSQTKTFSGGGETFNNIWCTGAGTWPFNFVGSNTFNDFKVDTPPHTVNFTAGTTTTVTTFTVTGTAGNLMTIGSITAATHTLMKAGGGTISSDYLSISNSTATPATTWYAWANSTDGGNNTWWIFTVPPSSTSIKTINWLVYTSVKTVKWLAISSIKSFNWLQ